MGVDISRIGILISVVCVRMSSGNAMTTGPGRPEIAIDHARRTTSAVRLTSVISVAYLAMDPYTFL